MLQKLHLHFSLWNRGNVGYNVARVDFLASGDSGSKI